MTHVELGVSASITLGTPALRRLDVKLNRSPDSVLFLRITTMLDVLSGPRRDLTMFVLVGAQVANLRGTRRPPRSSKNWGQDVCIFVGTAKWFRGIAAQVFGSGVRGSVRQS